MGNDKISVIVPIYNIEDYLDECIESITQQIYENLEIILVDDGSTDDCPRLIDEWAQKDNRIMAVHKQNGGQGDSRNYGFSRATGDYIAYIDGDDRIDKEYFLKLMETLKKNDADMSGCRFYRNNVDSDGYRYPDSNETYRFVASPEGFMERLYNDFGVFCTVWGKLYKREVIVDEMFSKIKFAEDARVMRGSAFRCKKIAYIPDPLYMYRDRPGSMMTAKRVYSLDNQKERMYWLDEDIEFYRSINNNRLQAVAEKAYCFNLFSDWKCFDKECKEYYRPRYFKALRHMIVNKGNSFAAKCKYIVFGFKMLFA